MPGCSTLDAAPPAASPRLPSLRFPSPVHFLHLSSFLLCLLPSSFLPYPLPPLSPFFAFPSSLPSFLHLLFLSFRLFALSSFLHPISPSFLPSPHTRLPLFPLLPKTRQFTTLSFPSMFPYLPILTHTSAHPYLLFLLHLPSHDLFLSLSQLTSFFFAYSFFTLGPFPTLPPLPLIFHLLYLSLSFASQFLPLPQLPFLFHYLRFPFALLSFPLPLIFLTLPYLCLSLSSLILASLPLSLPSPPFSPFTLIYLSLKLDSLPSFPCLMHCTSSLPHPLTHHYLNTCMRSSYVYLETREVMGQ